MPPQGPVPLRYPSGGPGRRLWPPGILPQLRPLGHTLTPVPGAEGAPLACPEAPGQEQAGRGQRQVPRSASPAASPVPRGAQRAAEQRFQPECRPEPCSGLRNKINKSNQEVEMQKIT